MLACELLRAGDPGHAEVPSEPQGEWLRPQGSKQHNRLASAKGAFRWPVLTLKGLGKRRNSLVWPF